MPPEGRGLAAALMLALAGCEPQASQTGETADPVASAQAAAAIEAATVLPRGSALTTPETSTQIILVGEVDMLTNNYMTIKADEGAVLVVVEYKVTNSTPYPVAAQDIPTLSLVDTNGVRYAADTDKTIEMHVSYPATDPGRSQLNPGVTKNVAVIFQVAKAAFDPTAWLATLWDGQGAKVHLPALGPVNGGYSAAPQQPTPVATPSESPPSPDQDRSAVPGEK